MKGKLIIFSAPSGSGKSTIINALVGEYGLRARFSISATSRAPRGEEQHGVHYYFLSEQDFRDRIARGDFLEYEEVYTGHFYGTLRSEIDNALNAGENVILDIDVKGAQNVKSVYRDQALTIFIQPPSLQALRERLVSRGTDAPERIEQRLQKAEAELAYAPLFDCVVTNDRLRDACDRAYQYIIAFLGSKCDDK